jgi:hypothetical protein
MKAKKLRKPDDLATRAIGYAAFIENNRANLTDLAGNSTQEIQQINQKGQALKALGDQVDAKEREFLDLRSQLKNQTAALESELSEQVGYAREYAKRRKLTEVTNGLKDFTQPHTRHKKPKTPAPGTPSK